MRKINIILSYLSLLSIAIIWDPKLYTFFWPSARIALLIIVFSRPLADIFSQTRIWLYLRKVVSIRQWIWIICWMFALAHWIGYFLSIDFTISNILSNSAIRNIKTMIWSWLRAMTFMFLPLITSHRFWMRKLWRNRKTIQRLTYPAFIITAAHIAIVTGEYIKFSTILIIYSIIYFLAYKKIKIAKLISQSP